VRLQSGWARCEQHPGSYDFAWLDAIVDDARAQGVQPWLELSYHNPLYGGDTTLGSALPSGAAREAWDAWVTAIVQHFRNRVSTWSVWNEPDLRGANPPALVADFTVHTVGLVRREQPDARLWTLSLAGWNVAYVNELLRTAAATQTLPLIDAILYHGYAARPEQSYGNLAKFRTTLRQAGADQVRLLQGENGCPSDRGSFGALANEPWTEVSQAKWNLRRLLGDRLHGVPVTNLFSISDMRYPGRLNTKGLLRTDEQHAVTAVKQAYHAYRHVCAVLDARHLRHPAITVTAPGHMAGALGDPADGSLVVALWRDKERPGETLDCAPCDVQVDAALDDPVLVDLRSGWVHAIPPAVVTRTATSTSIAGVPTYDSPMLILPRASVRLAPAAPSHPVP
jgi:hypothetical protein